MFVTTTYCMSFECMVTFACPVVPSDMSGPDEAAFNALLYASFWGCVWFVPGTFDSDGLPTISFDA